MEIYLKTLELLEGYFDTKDWRQFFLQGGCFWFANYLYQRIENSVLMINRMEEHCAICLSDGLYDVRGKISPYGFHPATEREISFMKKNYIPKFDVNMLEKYLVNNATKCTKHKQITRGQNDEMHKIQLISTYKLQDFKVKYSYTIRGI